MKDLRIGLAFSGGGFRASAFCLGVLTYLDRVKYKEQPLLEKVYALSTVSGGTITGTRYAIGIKNGESLEQIYKDLYDFLRNVDLVNLSLDRLISDEGWTNDRVKSIINAFADVYSKQLFKDAKFGNLLSASSSIHLKHISFNATEFANGVQFRFQVSEKIIKPEPGEPDKGIIGNYYYRISESLADQIRMGDILASSSCFPGGFEPINFPTDFVLPDSDELSKLKKDQNYPVGLMDGGIVDNQGIEPLLLANQRIKRNEPELGESNAFDLMIVSDVASPYMEDYKATKVKPLNWFRKRTPSFFLSLNSFLLLSFLALLWYSVSNQKPAFIILSTFFITLNIIIIFLALLAQVLIKKANPPSKILSALIKLLRLKFGVYDTIITNRINSVIKMANEVFLKHVRGLQYSKLYKDKSWENRRIMNAIYELRKDESKLLDKIKNGKISKALEPSAKIQEISALATSMGTTLWFSESELKKKNMLNALIACGQFNLCWNLLEYIEKIEKNKDNTNQNHLDLINCKQQLMNDWLEFNKDPFWMVKQSN
ncbi:MAG: patatin-like phospholipase family protein [Bacteroidetes bacterium]|nr:patatin-like phospholipase family protein [Bacteroidota bacterium]